MHRRWARRQRDAAVVEREPRQCPCSGLAHAGARSAKRAGGARDIREHAHGRLQDHLRQGRDELRGGLGGGCDSGSDLMERGKRAPGEFPVD